MLAEQVTAVSQASCVILFRFVSIRQTLNVSGLARAHKHVSPLCLAAQDGGDFVGVPFVLALSTFVPLHCCAPQMTEHAVQSVTDVIVGGCLFWPATYRDQSEQRCAILPVSTND